MKYKNRGHTKAADIKLIEKAAQVTPHDSGYFIRLHIHVHHYSNVTFDENSYLVSLNAALNLEPGSIRHQPPVERRKEPVPVTR